MPSYKQLFVMNYLQELTKATKRSLSTNFDRFRLSCVIFSRTRRVAPNSCLKNCCRTYSRASERNGEAGGGKAPKMHFDRNLTLRENPFRKAIHSGRYIHAQWRTRWSRFIRANNVILNTFIRRLVNWIIKEILSVLLRLQQKSIYHQRTHYPECNLFRR